MGTHLTPDEVKQNHIEKLGDSLGNLYHGLWPEVAQLHSKWNEYVELFGTNPLRVELLNKSAPLFFRTVQDSLWESIILHITRLTDPPKSCGRDNLSVRCLANQVDEEIKSTMNKLIEKANEKSDFCRDWRNRFLAHKDYGLVDGEAEPLASASRAKVKEALESITVILNSISEHYLDTTVGFGLLKNSNGGESLIYILDDGLKAGRERRERIKAGKYSSMDLERRNL